jgi:hypothetical protein
MIVTIALAIVLAVVILALLPVLMYGALVAVVVAFMVAYAVYAPVPTLVLGCIGGVMLLLRAWNDWVVRREETREREHGYMLAGFAHDLDMQVRVINADMRTPMERARERARMPPCLRELAELIEDRERT